MGTNGMAERVATEAYHPPEDRTSPLRNPPPTQPQQPQIQSNNRNQFLTSVSGAFTAIALILSVRLLLLLSIIGAFILGQTAMQNQNAFTLWTLGIFCAFTLPVLTYLDIQTRRRG